MPDPLSWVPPTPPNRNALADLGEYLRRSGRNLAQGAGAAVDWLAGGAQTGAQPTMALMRGDALDQPFLPTAESGGRIGAIASALSSVVNPVKAPAGALGAGPVVRSEGGLYHGTRGNFTEFDTPYVYLTPERQAAADYAEGVHLGGRGDGAPQVLDVAARPGKTWDINDVIEDAMERGWDIDQAIHGQATQNGPSSGVRYLEYDHPSAGGGPDHRVIVSLNPQEDLLIMSPEARAARAAEQGYDTGRTLYHGSNADIDAFRPSEWGHFGPGVYLSEQPSVAAAYGDAVYPVHTRGPLFNARPGFETRLKGAEAQDLIDAMPAKAAHEAWKDNKPLAQKRLDEQGYIDRETMWNYLQSQVGREGAQEILKARGYGGIEGIGDGAETVVFDPANIRGKFAAFDPARAGESDLLASRAGIPTPADDRAKRESDAALAAWLRQQGRL